MKNFERVSHNLENQPEKIEQLSQPMTEQAIIPYSEEHVNLRLREHDKNLSQEDFDQLLDLDFQVQLQLISPINVVFSPEYELAKINSLPREQKKEALESFKKKLANQRRAIGACRVFIERAIQFNHDIPREKLMGIVGRFSAHFGFDDQQKQIIEQIIDMYYKNRQKVLEARQRFPDDHDLVHWLTGVRISKDERIDVSVGPISIDIETNGFNAGRLYEGTDQPIIGFKDRGFAFWSLGDNPVYYSVINQDKSIRTAESGDPTSEKTRRHEHEHHKNALFKAIFQYPDVLDVADGLETFVAEKDIETKKAILEYFFCEARAIALERVKDEITAYLISHITSSELRYITLSQLQHRLDNLFFKEDKDGPYDYLYRIRNLKQFKNDSIYQEAVQKILIQEYRDIIESAAQSYMELVNKRNYSNQDAVALLTDKSLVDWPKTIRRLLEQSL